MIRSGYEDELSEQYMDSQAADDERMSVFFFVRRKRYYKFEDWFWLKAHYLYCEHSYASSRPAAIKNMWCVFLIRFFLLALQVSNTIIMVFLN